MFIVYTVEFIISGYSCRKLAFGASDPVHYNKWNIPQVFIIELKFRIKEIANVFFLFFLESF